ncbi:MAG: hypothetical protein E7062_07460 [Spirochaetaceae bacterium]|nr:hypothetical protein [Spirochaetaceae bacterium]
MATTTNIHVLLKYYATRQNNALVNVLDFCEYVRRYAQHHVEEQPELINYLSHSHDAIKKELDKLADSKQILLLSSDLDKQNIIVIAFYIEKFSSLFQDIQKNITVPFPSHTYLPKNTPNEIYQNEQLDTFLNNFIDDKENSQKLLYCLQFPRSLPTILFPSTLPASILLEIALLKLQTKLKKEEYHDYFLKKLKIANPGKELSVKNFFTAVTKKPELALESIKTSAENFYQWNQLCYFIRQDFEKIKDLTQEDISLLQSICIIEISISFFRTKAQQDLQKTTALKNLELVLNKPPYYFTKDAINLFTDSRGIPLLGQYSEKDLSEYLYKATTESIDEKLPALLTFKEERGNRFYISKTKVIPLIVRLCSDARETVRDIVTKECYAALKRFEQVPELKNQNLFESRLESIVKTVSPVLYALLNTHFLRSVYFETRSSNEVPIEILNLFQDGQIPPYSELLMISKDEIYTDAKIMLPLWYTVPVISWFLSLLFGPSKSKKKKEKKQLVVPEKKIESDEPELTVAEKKDPVISRKVELKQAAAEAEKFYVPETSSLERELSSYEQIWNKILTQPAHDNLTDDVNSLIRDYTRKILKTLRASNFTPDRIRGLAETLVKTPNMQKIKSSADLCMYIQLYMVKLIKNMN